MGLIKSRITIANVDIANANTEYSYELPANTKKFKVKLRNVGYPLKLAIVEGDSGTTYVNIAQGKSHEQKDIRISNTILYFQTTAGSQVVEIISWI